MDWCICVLNHRINIFGVKVRWWGEGRAPGETRATYSHADSDSHLLSKFKSAQATTKSSFT